MVVTTNTLAERKARVSVRRLGRDDLGQVSFSVIAVVILLAAGAAGSYMAKRELDEAAVDRRAVLIASMEEAIQDVSQELGLYGAASAREVVSGWSEFPVNESRISESYSSSLQAYVSSAFPRQESGFELQVSNWTGGLFFVERNTLDLVSSDEPEADQVELEGTTMDYAGMPAPSAEVLAERTANPYYVAVGNFTVLVSSDDVVLWKDASFLRPVISALPFLETKLRAFESASEGEFSDLGRLVSYMLTALGQLRILEGYGVPMYSDGLDTAPVVTEQDVYRAVSVGLLLEQARLFRAIDPSYASQTATACGGDGSALSLLLGSSGMYADPAELFLWFLGKKKVELEPRMVIAQAVAGLTDQLTVKMMDYLGWLGMLDVADVALDMADNSLDSLISLFTGEDKATVAVAEWISESLRTVGAPAEVYSELFSHDQDMSMFVPEKTYFVEDASGALYPVWVGNVSTWVDVPAYNILTSDQLAGFYPRYKELQGTLRGLVYDSVNRLAFDIAGAATIELRGVSVDPTDGEDLFESMSENAGDIELCLDPEAVIESSKDLPMFSAQYDLSVAFSEFLTSSGQGLFPEGIMDAVYSDVAASLISSARYGYIPDLEESVEEQLAEIVRQDVTYDTEWGVGATALCVFRALCADLLTQISSLVEDSISKLDDGFAGPAVDSIASLLTYGAGAFPGLEELAESALSGFASEVLAQKRMAAFKPSVYLDLDSPFEFWDGNLATAQATRSVLNETMSVEVVGGLAPMQAVPYDPELGYGSLSNLFPTGDVLVQIQRPWEFDRSAEEYPNTHLTSLTNVSATPYTTQWTVSVLALVPLEVSSENTALQTVLSDGTPTSSSSAKVELCLPIVLHSAWPLGGVDYNPTNTVLSDGVAVARMFCDMVWKKLEPVVGWVKDGLERVFSFVQKAFEVLASFATRVVKAITSALQAMVETLQEFLQKFADTVLGKVIQTFVDITGRVEFRISLYGFVFIIQTSIPDLLFRDSKDLLRLMVYTKRFGPGMTFGVRIAKLSDGRYDIVANGTLAFKNTTVEVAIDPLMHVMRRLVEVHVKSSTWGLDLVIPEVQPYETAEVSTADLPGVGALLSNIPIPALGLSASIKAGLRMKYSPPFPTDVVVNEFEANPAGDDSGKEWVELYNPLKEPRCVDGWMISTVHGRSSVMTLTGSVPAGGLKVYTYPETSIDNGYSGDPFNDGDAIVLMDPTGKVIDLTPTLMDIGNDLNTHQRSWDGGPRWVLKPGTKDNSNGIPILLSTSDFIAKALFEAFKDAFLQTNLTEVSASLEFLKLFAKRVLNNFIENLLSIVSEVIHEVIFFIEVALSDASGSGSVGFRASFVVTGEAIVDVLRWLIHTLATFIVNLGRASNPIAYPVFPGSFLEGLYLRFEVLFQVGAPKMLKAIGATGDFEQRFTCAIAIAPNIPAIGKLVGRDWGRWCLEFGVYLEGVPREFIQGFLSKDVGDKVDLWIVKARVYGT